MPEVVKSALAQSSLAEQAVELMRHHSTVEWFTVLAGKDEVQFVRTVPAGQFAVLYTTMPAQCVADQPRHDNRPPASCGFRLKQLKGAIPDEARRFLQALDGHRLEALYSVALTMGLRQGEALGLRWKDVDLELGYLRVEKQLQRINEGLYFESFDSRSVNHRRGIT
jgi:hypothetical protein